ncbi:MAG: filamentous hemagglutinin N-terminal domain-containing protein, partial [Methylococcales bacterium]|nr:filamentous hemagglutinin N-terminal domain-containing protein [Methylococcales bacterium]
SITNTPNAIINWGQFNISPTEITKFIQQNPQSAVLNRVIGQDPSKILGHLLSNGKVFLINPNGIVFGTNSVVDTQGLIASTLNISNKDFLKGNYHFVAENESSRLVNQGVIRAGSQGNIILIAPDIENSGVISTDGGKIILAAASTLTVTNLDEPHIRFQIQSPKNSILNLGEILANGGAINLFANNIHHSGALNANTAEIDRQGRIKLVASNTIEIDDKSVISANHSHQTGGMIQITGKNITLGDESQVEANGQTGGGDILTGGDYRGENANIKNATTTTLGSKVNIRANATHYNKGGKVIIWSDDTTVVHGNIEAKGGEYSGDGGFVEVSGKQHLTMDGFVDVTAKKGKTGQLLLDPGSITIKEGDDSAPSGSMDVFHTQWLAGQLNTANVTLTTDNSTNNHGQDITVESPFNWDSDHSLELDAGNDINLNAPIKNTANGHLILDAKGTSNITEDVTLETGTFELSGNSSWTGSTLSGDVNNYGTMASVGNNTLAGTLVNHENEGTINWRSGFIKLSGATSSIQNEVGATFIADSTGKMIGVGTFKNEGTLKKTTTTPEAQFNVPFNNDGGSFDLNKTTITLLKGGHHENDLSIDNGTLKMQGSAHTLGDKVTVKGTGVLETNATTQTGNLSIENPKTIITRPFENRGVLTINDNSVFKVTGGDLTNAEIGTIKGKGTLDVGNATLTNKGILSPGG